MNRELKEILECEKELYGPKLWKDRTISQVLHFDGYRIYRFIRTLRKAEFYKTRNRLKYLYYFRKSMVQGVRLGYNITPGVLGKGVRLWHGNIVINSSSRVGDGCIFHGDNCIGNNGVDNNCPVLGKNVDVGVGAKIIGPVTLADGIRVGANAVVTKSFTEPGITIGGVPAVKIK